jgi:4-carboxymuconolactone decarboxylase
MTTTTPGRSTKLLTLDSPTATLVRLAAVVADGGELEIRAALGRAKSRVPQIWIEELLLQTYLFAGFPRALNAFREWRRFAPAAVDRASGAFEEDTSGDDSGGESVTARGEETCRAVYGKMYEKLRGNVRALHPDLDGWMIAEGYGKVLSRPGLDLPRRELCIVAACAATGQDRQLHSHLHGALNVGVAAAVVRDALDALGSDASGLSDAAGTSRSADDSDSAGSWAVVSPERLDRARLLLSRVVGK